MNGNKRIFGLCAVNVAWLLACSAAPSEAPATAPTATQEIAQAEPAPAPKPAELAPGQVPAEPAVAPGAQPSAQAPAAPQDPGAPAPGAVPAAQPSAADTKKPTEKTSGSAVAGPKPGEVPAAKPSEAAAAPSAPATTTTEAPKAPAAAPAGVAPCGDDGQPDCPLEAFMSQLDVHVDAGDLAKVAAGLTRTAGFAPDPSWNAGETGWATIARAGADAAKAGDLAAAQQSCKSCHKTWRKKYKDGYRSRPLP